MSQTFGLNGLNPALHVKAVMFRSRKTARASIQPRPQESCHTSCSLIWRRKPAIRAVLGSGTDRAAGEGAACKVLQRMARVDVQESCYLSAGGDEDGVEDPLRGGRRPFSR